MESEKIALKNQLKLAQSRIESLQKALKGEDSEEEEEMNLSRDIRSMSRDIRASVAKEFEAATRDFLTIKEETPNVPVTTTTPTVAKET